MLNCKNVTNTVKTESSLETGFRLLRTRVGGVNKRETDGGRIKRSRIFIRVQRGKIFSFVKLFMFCF